MSESLPFNILYVVYFLATLSYAFTMFTRRRGLILACRGLLITALVLHTVVIAERWLLAGRPPLSNMFETLVLLGWGITLVYLAVEFKYGLRILGTPAALGSLLSLGLATLVFPGTIEPLMPALKNSFWLTTHVSFCFVGYGAFSIGYLMCLLILLRRADWHRRAAAYVIALSLVAVAAGVFLAQMQHSGAWSLSLNLRTMLAVTAAVLVGAALLTPAIAGLAGLLRLPTTVPDADVIEQALHRTLIFGFLFLSVGIITGAVWAQTAWGRYWGWDPKETWSLVTWLIYGIYLHVRLNWKKQGVVTIWLAVIGFWAVVFTYFGVNFLLPGLHSYA